MNMPQPFSTPAGGQIQPGAVTYTTSTGPDGQVIYHPFRRVFGTIRLSSQLTNTL